MIIELAGAVLGLVVVAAPSPVPDAPHAARKPLLAQVDHFYLVSSNAERLFKLFRDDLGLPESWPYRSWGDFSSGGLTLGNTSLEFLSRANDGGPEGSAAFKGIAFEPVGDAAAAIAELDARGVRHGEEVPSMVTFEGKQFVGWSTVTLEGMPPDGAHVFICDYKARARVAEGRQAASTALVARKGGPLGIVSIREIVIGVRSPADASQAWSAIADGAATRGLFAFGSGPRIRLAATNVEAIDRIVLGVRSTAAAKRALAAKGMLRKGTGPVAIDPAAVGGVRIELVEQRD